VLSSLVNRLVKNAITQCPKAIKKRKFSNKPSYHVMADSSFLIKWTNVDALIAIDMVHAFICSGPIFVPVTEAFLSIKGPFQQTRIG
jgi:hypothetical protein